LGADYFLETSRLFAPLMPGDTLTTLVFLTIVSRNLRHLADHSPQGREHLASLPDEARTPVTVYAIAKDLGLSYETVRRHVRRLVDHGVCRRGAEGMVVPAEVFLRPDFQRAQARNHENLLRLTARLEGSASEPG
jgi:predicted ArsR family transcriptional regulator